MRILETCMYNLSWKCFLEPQGNNSIQAAGVDAAEHNTRVDFPNSFDLDL